jgi:hypothetical protein
MLQVQVVQIANLMIAMASNHCHITGHDQLNQMQRQTKFARFGHTNDRLNHMQNDIGTMGSRYRGPLPAPTGAETF